MKKIMFISLFTLQSVLVFAYDRIEFDRIQAIQENNIKIAFSNGRLTQNEYDKLIHEQDLIKEAIETADIDHHWTKLEYDHVKQSIKKANKRLRRYQLNTERF